MADHPGPANRPTPGQAWALPTPQALTQAIRTCRDNPRFLSELSDILRQAEQEVQQLGAACKACGNCCHFDRMEHRLFASTGELALLAFRPPACLETCQRDRCPYQQDGLCTARDVRPLGCRTFFCDPALAGKAQDIHEFHHHRVRQLHQNCSVPYAYAEVLSSLLSIRNRCIDKML